MSEETVSLRDYVDRILEEKDKALKLAVNAEHEALILASKSIDARLEKLNELRTEVIQDRSSYVTKDRHEADMKLTDGRISSLENSKSWAMGAIFIIGLLGGGLGSVITKMILAR